MKIWIEVFTYVEGMSAFKQSLLAAFVFAVTSFIFRLIVLKVKEKSASVLEEQSRRDVVRHILHKDYIYSSDMNISSFGVSMALLLSFRWILLGCLILIFFFGIKSMLNADWLYFAAAWFAFNCFFEARSWVKDCSSDKYIKNIPEEIKEDVLKKFEVHRDQITPST